MLSLQEFQTSWPKSLVFADEKTKGQRDHVHITEVKSWEQG